MKKVQEFQKKPLNKNDIIKKLEDNKNSNFAILSLTFMLVTFILMFTSWGIGFWNFIFKDFIISLPIAFVFIALHRLSASADIRAVKQDRYFICTTKIYKKEYTDTSGVDESPCWEYILWYKIQNLKKTLSVSESIYNSTEVGDDVFVVAIYDSKKRVKHTEIVFLSTLWTTEGSDIKYINSLPKDDK